MAFRLSLRLASQTPPKRIVSVGVGSPNGRSLWTRPPTVLSRPANCTSSGVNHSLAPRQSPMQGLTQKLALRTISVESAGQSPVHLSALQKGLRIGAALAFLAGGFGCLTLISEHYVTLKEEAAFLQSASLHAAVGVGISVTSIVALASLAKTRSMMLNFPIRFSLLVCIPAIGSAMLLNQIPGDKAPLRYLWWAAEMAAQGAVWAPLVVLMGPAAFPLRIPDYLMGAAASLVCVGLHARTEQTFTSGTHVTLAASVVALYLLAPVVLPVASAAVVAGDAVYLYFGTGIAASLMSKHMTFVLQEFREPESVSNSRHISHEDVPEDQQLSHVWTSRTNKRNPLDASGRLNPMFLSGP